MTAVIRSCSYIIAHVPSFVRYGSKPMRDIRERGGSRSELETRIYENVRSYEDAVAYAPNQVFIGNLHPDELIGLEKPWYRHPAEHAERYGKFGEILPEEEFYKWLKTADDFDLVSLTPDFTERLRKLGASHPFFEDEDIRGLGEGVDLESVMEKMAANAGLPLYHNESIVGSIRSDHHKDDTLKAGILMENLLAKASGALSMYHLFKRADVSPGEIDFILSCSEEAVGDRYNRGGGSLSKAIGEMCGCVNATGHDIKAFCAAPIHAIMNAAALVQAGVFRKVVIVGGGSLAKIGMKYAAHLKNGMPVLEDLLGAFAFLVTKDDGESPVVRLDCIGKHDIGSGSNQQEIMTSLIVKPLEKIGLKMMDIDKYATEMHNPEVTVPAGSGNTPLTNYKIIGALAAIRKEIDRERIDDFVREKGMPGFSPTQGHIPAAVPYLGHALESMKQGQLKRTLFVAKGSLFLGRMSQLSDGLSFLMECNPKTMQG